jgi:hypothetical protein
LVVKLAVNGRERLFDNAVVHDPTCPIVDSTADMNLNPEAFVPGRGVRQLVRRLYREFLVDRHGSVLKICLVENAYG